MAYGMSLEGLHDRTDVQAGGGEYGMRAVCRLVRHVSR